MKFMCFYRPFVDSMTRPTPEFMARMQAYVEKSRADGVLLDTGGLEPGGRGVRVRMIAGKATVTEGPLPPATRVIAGFAVIRVASIADAIEHGKRFLAIAGDGESEIRPSFGMPGAPPQFLMLYRPAGPEPTTPPNAEHVAAIGRHVAELTASGVLVTSQGLTPTAKGKVVRLEAGKRTVVDGPFAEAKELIAGYALLEARSLAETVELTAEFLALAGDGLSEIRPLP